jgi:pSer/pThr/pTyr-binding forkhead associated (FHA) protein
MEVETLRPHLSKQVAEFLPVFKVFADDGAHSPVALDRPVCVVGRQQGTNLPLPAEAVSKVHAFIVREQGRVYLRDLASTNGVQLNGTPVQEAGLSDADTLRIGSYTLRCAHGFGAADENEQKSAYVPMDVPPPPAAELVSENARFPIPNNRHTLLIGRREGCDLRLEDPSVAPVHAIIFEIDGKRYVHDFGAPTGTTINGQPIHRTELNPGDELKVGQVTLRYSVKEETAAAVESAPDAEEPMDVATPAELVDIEDSVAPVAAAESEIIDVEISAAPSAGPEAMEIEIDSVAEASAAPEAIAVETDSVAEGSASSDSAIPLAVDEPETDEGSDAEAEAAAESVPQIAPALDQDEAEEAEAFDPNADSDIPALFFDPDESETSPQTQSVKETQIAEDVEALLAIPEEITNSSRPIPIDAGDEPIDTPDFSVAASDKPSEEDIAGMVDDVAERAQILKDAWIDFTSDDGKEQ